MAITRLRVQVAVAVNFGSICQVSFVELAAWKGGRAKQSVACKLLRRLRKHADAILQFIGDLVVPFTNNVAEPAVRMQKVK